MTVPGFNAAVSIYRSSAIYRAHSFGTSANGNGVAPASSVDCIHDIMLVAEEIGASMDYGTASWWCEDLDGDGGGGGGVVDPVCDPACSRCQDDPHSETGRSRFCVTTHCEPYTVPCEYWEPSH